MTVPAEPEPEVYACGRRVTEADVFEALGMLGDETVADYRAGRLSKAHAYDIARRWLREFAQLRRGFQFL